MDTKRLRENAAVGRYVGSDYIEAADEIDRLRLENEALKIQVKANYDLFSEGDDEIGRLRLENEALEAALQKVLDDSETGVVPRSHLDLIERLLRGEGDK